MSPAKQGHTSGEAACPLWQRGPLSEARAGDCQRQTICYFIFQVEAVPAGQPPLASPGHKAAGWGRPTPQKILYELKHVSGDAANILQNAGLPYSDLNPLRGHSI